MSFPFPLRRRFNPVPLQDINHGPARDSVTEVGERAEYAPVTPVPILFCHPNHQSLDLSGNPRLLVAASEGAVLAGQSAPPR
jgi:hypothetical protein